MEHRNNNWETFTDTCVLCGNTFTADNPCWNDDALMDCDDAADGMLHKDGECATCTASKYSHLETGREAAKWLAARLETA